jgi:hypothetical protein
LGRKNPSKGSSFHAAGTLLDETASGKNTEGAAARPATARSRWRTRYASPMCLAVCPVLGCRDHPEAGDGCAAWLGRHGHEVSANLTCLEVHEHAPGSATLGLEFVICSSSAVRLGDEEGRIRDADACRGHLVASPEYARPARSGGHRPPSPPEPPSTRSEGLGPRIRSSCAWLLACFSASAGSAVGEGGGAGREVDAQAAVASPASSHV